MKTRPRGFSLIEALYAMFLTFLVLSALTFLLQQVSAAKTTIKESGLMAEIYHASSLIRTDLGASSGTVTPASGEAAQLTVVTLAPNSDYEFDADAPTNVADSYITTNVTYRLGDGFLRRIRTGGVTGDDALLPLESFTVRRSEGRLDVDYGVKNERRSRVYTIVFRIKP